MYQWYSWLNEINLSLRQREGSRNHPPICGFGSAVCGVRFAVAVAVAVAVKIWKNEKRQPKPQIAIKPQVKNRKANFAVTLRFYLRFAVGVAVATIKIGQNTREFLILFFLNIPVLCEIFSKNYFDLFSLFFYNRYFKTFSRGTKNNLGYMARSFRAIDKKKDVLTTNPSSHPPTHPSNRPGNPEMGKSTTYQES